jgi:hypothetical protein
MGSFGPLRRQVHGHNIPEEVHQYDQIWKSIGMGENMEERKRGNEFQLFLKLERDCGRTRE